MNRRTFFKNIVVGCAALGIAPSLLSSPSAPIKTTALDDIRVRSLLEHIKKQMEKAMEYYVFEENNDLTRERIVNTMEGFIKPIKGGQQLHDYVVVCDARNNLPHDIDAKKLNVDIYLKMKPSAQYINLHGQMTSI